MYLKTIKLKNTGPIKNFETSLPFSTENKPKPVLLVGKNGCGKSTFLSFIVNALVSTKQHVFEDVEVEKGKVYRIRSSLGIHNKEEFFFAKLTFDNGITLTEWQLDRKKEAFTTPESLQSLDNTWHAIPVHETSHFALNLGPLASLPILEEMLNRTGLLYFPADRFEPPDWLNSESLSSELRLPELERMKGRTSRRIFSRNRLKPTLEWLNSVIFDMILNERENSGKSSAVVIAVQMVLQKVLCEKETDFLQFSIGDRKSRIISAVVIRDDQPIRYIKDLMSLSAGESALFCLFTTIIRDADLSDMEFNSISEINGLAVIDEVDMHLHVGLQHRVLPDLIAMFPKVQFILSVHSPMVVIGLEARLGADGFEIIELPDGDRITSESYKEFEDAFQAFSQTKAFQKSILLTVKENSEKLLVLLEGETDPLYMTSAARLTGRADILEAVEFKWVGAKDEKTGQGFHTGKDALNSTLILLKAKPEFIKRPILLLYDNDTNKNSENMGNIYVGVMPTNEKNSLVEAGIENLLPQEIISRDMFDEKISKKRNGNTVVTTTLDKMRLCKHVCETRLVPADFANFIPILEYLAELILKIKGRPV